MRRLQGLAMLHRTSVVKLDLPVIRLRAARSPRHGKASSHNRTHPHLQSLWMLGVTRGWLRVRFYRLMLQRPRRMRAGAAAPSEADGATRRGGSGSSAATRWLCYSSSLKLRRRARLRRDLQDLEELSYMPPRLLRGPGAKRGPGGPSSSSSEGPESDSSDAVDHLPGPARVSHIAKRFGGGSARASWALR